MNTAKNTHTIGIDLGDKSHETCTLNAEGEILERSSVLNNQAELIRFSKANRGATLIMEAGCHSPWISRLFNERGHKVVVANPRKVRAIYQTDNKNDERDALLLARIGRFDRNLLYGIEHKSEAHQRALKTGQKWDSLLWDCPLLWDHHPVAFERLAPVMREAEEVEGLGFCFPKTDASKRRSVIEASILA